MKNKWSKIFTLFFMLMAFNTSFAQGSASGLKVTGIVVDTNDDPLTGVTVLVSGTTQGTVTNIDGEFSIQVQNPAIASLEFSYVGYQSQKIALDGKTYLRVVMDENARMLDDVVVVGYGTMKRKEVTSSVETVSSEKFNGGVTRSPLELIQGKVAGLNLTSVNGANPNASTSIQLRGVASINGDRSPLIVIDGVPGGNLDLINPDDIASFNVLKDGSAAAIYGTRGNAGVILITTKKGISGESYFQYSGYMSHEAVNKKLDVLSASQYRDLIKQGVISETFDYGGNTDLFKELINTSNLTQHHNISLSGGSQQTTYRASVNYNNREGITHQNSREQFGGRMNISQRGLNDLLLISLNLATNINKANMLGGGDFQQALTRNPTYPLYNEDGSFFEVAAWDVYNPLSRLANRTSRRNQQTTSADVTAMLTPIENLNISATAAYQRNNYNDRYYRSMKDWDNRPGTNYGGMGYASKTNYLFYSKSLESTATYRYEINHDNVINVLAGYSYFYSTAENLSASNSGFTTDGFQDWNLGAGSAITDTKLPRPGLGSSKTDNTLVAVFGRLNYSLKNKYHLQAILRHEGSSKFGSKNKWGNFPAISAGWSIGEEDFIKRIEQINELKLRVGYGVTGNQGIAPYQSLVLLSTGGVYPIEGTYYQTYGAANNPNPYLKWEEKKEVNFGIDFGLFNSRITGSLDFYNRDTNDLLYQYNAQQPSYVRDKIWMNLGTIRSRGVELQLSGIVVNTPDFGYTIDFTASTNANKLVSLSNETFQANYLTFGNLPSTGNLGSTIRLQEGWNIGQFYGRKFAGFTDDGNWLFYKKDGTTGTPSEMTEEDKFKIGNGMPKWYMSLTNRFTYKNFDLTLMFRGKFKYDILNVKDIFLGNPTWLPSNVLKSATTKYKHIKVGPQYSNYYLEKGDFVKLDNLTLGYNFVMNNPYITKLRVYGSARNLFTITKYKGINPDIQDTGFEVGVDGLGYYPSTVSWSLGLQMTF